MLRIYLDNCCYNRPFDLPSNPMIVFESSAKILIQTLITKGKVELASSFVIYEEVQAITNKAKRELIIGFLNNIAAYIAKDKLNDVMPLADEVMRTGIKYKTVIEI